MEKTLIIYYSLEGNIDFVANELSSALNADKCRLETVKEYPKKGLVKYLHGGKDTLKGFTPELKTAIPDLSPYSTIIIGAPVWASLPAAPIMTFLANADFTGKKVSFFTSSMGGSGSKTLETMASNAKNASEIIPGFAVVNPMKKQDAAKKAIADFVETLKK